MATEQRLLILDDDADVGRTVRLMARRLGVECQTVDCAQELFDEVERWRPTHVIVDLVMPDMDGVEVLRELAARKCDARVIICSGVGPRVLDAAQRAAREHCLDVGGVIAKPFSLGKLREVLSCPGRGGADAQGGEAAPAGPRTVPVTEASLLRAIEARQFEVHYQPKVACASGVPVGVEALVRWRHPEAGLIMPDRFIGLAESLGLLEPITQQVLETALQWLGHSDRRGGSPPGGYSVAVNISARQLGDVGFADLLASQCHCQDIDCTRITLELTETAAMEDPVVGLDLVTKLRVKGFRVSIDDFGTGYSSMAQLARLPFSELKVDRSFVMDSSHSAEARSIVRSVVDLAHNLGLNAVAEGVEDEAGFEFLRSIGCDLAQGFHIARPMEAAELDGWLQCRTRAN